MSSHVEFVFYCYIPQGELYALRYFLRLFTLVYDLYRKQVLAWPIDVIQLSRAGSLGRTSEPIYGLLRPLQRSS